MEKESLKGQKKNYSYYDNNKQKLVTKHMETDKNGVLKVKKITKT